MCPYYCKIRHITHPVEITMFRKIKRIVIVPILIVAFCTVLYVRFAKPVIERHEWQLSYAQQADPMFVIAHNPEYDWPDNYSMFALSKPIDLTFVAEDGCLTITDRTNKKTYNGTYKVNSWYRVSYQSYEITIEGKAGRANISNQSSLNPTLFMSINGYYLNFESTN